MSGGGAVSLRDDRRMWRAEMMVVTTNVTLGYVSNVRQVRFCRWVLPDESGKDNRRDTRSIDGSATGGGPPVAVSPKHSHSDPCGKPENHGKGFNGSNGKLVCCTREACRHQDEVSHCEQCPYGCEKHKVDAVRRPAPPRVRVRINDYNKVSEDVPNSMHDGTYCMLSSRER
jgi:hypothetical protein